MGDVEQGLDLDRRRPSTVLHNGRAPPCQPAPACRRLGKGVQQRWPSCFLNDRERKKARGGAPSSHSASLVLPLSPSGVSRAAAAGRPVLDQIWTPLPRRDPRAQPPAPSHAPPHAGGPCALPTSPSTPALTAPLPRLPTPLPQPRWAASPLAFSQLATLKRIAG